VYTALYGRGKGESTLAGDETNTPRLTFEDVVWSTDDGDPADKPQGQKFVEDVEATALYGRNGRKRTGVIEFDDCEDAEALLGLTWDALQSINSPTVTIKATVSEMENVWGFSHEAGADWGRRCHHRRTRAIKRRFRRCPATTSNAVNTKLTIGTCKIEHYRRTGQLGRADCDAKAAGTPVRPMRRKTRAGERVHRHDGQRILSTGTNRSTDTEERNSTRQRTAQRTSQADRQRHPMSGCKVGDVWQWRTAITGGGNGRGLD
jgi:hypothetical protein